MGGGGGGGVLQTLKQDEIPQAMQYIFFTSSGIEGSCSSVF